MQSNKTTFAQVKNPWKKDLLRVSGMTIGSDSPPDTRAEIGSKYDSLFNKLKPGQCVKCPTEAVNTVAQAMRKWIKKQDGSGLSVRAMQRYPNDQSATPGRVWLMPAEGNKT